MSGEQKEEGLAAMESEERETLETPEADKWLGSQVNADGQGTDGNQGDRLPEGGGAGDGDGAGAEGGADGQGGTGGEGDGKPKEEEAAGAGGAEGGEAGDGKETNWSKARERIKQLEEENRALKEGKPAGSRDGAGGEGGDGGGAGAGGKPPVARREGAAVPPEAVFEALVKVASGEEKKFKREDLEAYIQTKFSPGDIKGVIDAARAGKFGEASDDILEMAREQLPLVIAESDNNRKREERVAVLEGERAQAVNELLAAFPEAKDAKSAVYAELDTAAKELEALIPGLSGVPKAPLIVRDYVQLRRKAARADSLEAQNAAQQKEIERLTGLIGKGVKPKVDAGGGEGGGTESADDWLKKRVGAK